MSLTTLGLGVGAVGSGAGVVVAGCAVKDAVRERIRKRRSAKDQSTTVSAAEASQSNIPYRLTHSQQQYPYQEYYPVYQQSFFPEQQQAPATGYTPAQSFYPTQTVRQWGTRTSRGAARWDVRTSLVQDRMTLLTEISKLRDLRVVRRENMKSLK